MRGAPRGCHLFLLSSSSLPSRTDSHYTRQPSCTHYNPVEHLRKSATDDRRSSIPTHASSLVILCDAVVITYQTRKVAHYLSRRAFIPRASPNNLSSVLPLASHDCTPDVHDPAPSTTHPNIQTGGRDARVSQCRSCASQPHVPDERPRREHECIADTRISATRVGSSFMLASQPHVRDMRARCARVSSSHTQLRLHSATHHVLSACPRHAAEILPLSDAGYLFIYSLHKVHICCVSAACLGRADEIWVQIACQDAATWGRCLARTS